MIIQEIEILFHNVYKETLLIFRSKKLNIGKVGVRTKTWTLTGTERNCEMYSRKQVLKALRLYRKCGSVTKTIRILGYPSRESMYLLSLIHI